MNPCIPVGPSPPPRAPARGPRTDAIRLENSLDAIAGQSGPGARLAALSYLDIARAVEARHGAPKPGPVLRCRRRLRTLRKPWARPGPLLKQCFAEGLRGGAEATLRYYGIAPQGVALPRAIEAALWPPVKTYEHVFSALYAARPAMARLEFPEWNQWASHALPSCTCRAAFDSATSELTVYIDWFNGPDESSGVHHAVPLFVATRRGRRFVFGNSEVNNLPITAAARGLVPYRFTPEHLLERMA